MHANKLNASIGPFFNTHTKQVRFTKHIFLNHLFKWAQKMKYDTQQDQGDLVNESRLDVETSW